MHVAAFVPYLLLYNAPAGTFTLSLLKNAVTIFSKNFTSADIKTSIGTSDNYAHVYYAVVPTNPLAIEEGEYVLKISSSGYTASETSYLGWVRRFDELTPTTSYTPYTDMQNPLVYRIKIYAK